jgi:arylsulfatase A-like enzyme
MKISKHFIVSLLLTNFLFACQDKKDTRPNILLIVADDLGYLDIGAFGGEIETPNLDALAAAGVKLTQFYVAPTCSPTRSMLLSGTDNHLAGLGNMAEELRENQQDNPGYEGYLNFRVAALPELLQESGYHTFMAGKWHLGLTNETSPAARGFNKYYSLLQGGAGHLSQMPLIGPNPAIYYSEDKRLSLPKDFYSTKNYSEKMTEYLENRPDDGKPFFAYLTYTAPHWPLQAPKESIAKYKGRYDDGYDVLQISRFERSKVLGLLDSTFHPTDRVPSEKAWNNLSNEEKAVEAKKMEIYAAMVDDLDKYLGNVLESLKRSGDFENTFIFFMSDNGPEGANLEVGWDDLANWVNECCDNSLENMGEADSYLWYGPNWARASAAPFRMFKGFTTEGGIRAPAIVHYPKSIKGGKVNTSMSTVMDVLPTILELAEVQHPKKFKGKEVLPLRGTSMLPALKGEKTEIHDKNYMMGWELFGRRAIRKGEWKIVWEPAAHPWDPRDPDINDDQWRLYNITKDPGEQNNLAAIETETLERMIMEWQNYVKETGVIVPDYGVGYAK